MDRAAQIRKAERFRALHDDPELLVLPNVWDPLGACLLRSLDYPAVATASAAVAYSLGYRDGQKIRFSAMTDAIARVAAAVDLPVSADIEAGYAEDLPGLRDNIRSVLDAGAVGINLEDGLDDGRGLRPLEAQCERIRAVRRLADKVGVPLVINARTDVFLSAGPDGESAVLDEALRRSTAYLAAGADCIYPILASRLETLRVIRSETGAPINVYASARAPSVSELEQAGISRLSLGPGLLKAAVTAMKRVAVELRDDGSYTSFTGDVVSSDEIDGFVSAERMP